MVGSIVTDRLSFPACGLPQALIGRTWFNGNPMALARMAATTDHLARPHVAVEVRGRESPNQLFCAIELFGHLRRVKAGGRAVSLHPLPIDQRRCGHPITFSMNGIGIDVDRLQSGRLVPIIHHDPPGMNRCLDYGQHHDQKPEP